MSPSTGPTPKPPPMSHATYEQESSIKRPSGVEGKRSSSWSHYHSRRPSNPFFLSRRAREQGSFTRKQQGEKISLTLDETLKTPAVRIDIGLATKPDIVHIVGVSHEAASSEATSHHERGISNPEINQVNNRAPDKHGVQLRTEIHARKAHNPSTAQKSNSRAEKSYSHPKTTRASTHPAERAHNSPSSSPDILIHQHHLHKGGTGQRRIMRTVSQDDYLLARGANPRTGVVTPSVHSGSSSLDDQGWLKIKEMSQQAKWRLKGDQWVSLSLDEPSPLPRSPHRPNNGARGRLLRMPPKLAHGRRNQHGMQIHDFEQHQIDSLTKPSHIASRIDRKQIEAGVELQRAGAQKDLVQSTSFPARLCPHHQETAVKRKPLGTPPGERLMEKLFRNNNLPESSTETGITKKGPVEQVRASSMPTPRKMRFYRPEDLGKALPDLPILQSKEQGIVEDESRSQGSSFLGQRPGEWIEDVSDWTTAKPRESKKSLPCPPTNNTPFRSHRMGKPRAKVFPCTVSPTPTSGLEDRQRRTQLTAHTEGRSAGPYHLRPGLPKRRHQRDQMTCTEQRPANCGFTNKHDVCHPPRPQTKPQGQSACTNEPTTKNRTIATGTAGPTHLSTITPTTTHITTVTPLPEDRLVSSSWREMPSPLRPGRPRAYPTSRPAMPQRTEGMHSVPQVSPQKEAEGHGQWRMSGMSDSDISAVSTSAEASPERDLIPRPLRPSHGNTAGLGQWRAAVAEGATHADQAVKTNQTCKGCSRDERQNHIDGSVPTPENRGIENMDPKVDSGLLSGSLPGTPQDHSSCCSECCAIGCHESCLGHRSPYQGNSASGMASSFGVMKQAFRNSIRLSRRVRIRTSAGGSRETETEEVAELETPTSWEMGGPVSLGLPAKMHPQDFWGSSSSTPEGTRGKRIASNASGSSVRTCEMPTAGSGIGAVVEALLVPFGALRMWVRRNPQLLALLQMLVLRLFEMSKHVVQTMGKAYRVAYIYSKTGRISAGKQASLGGFVRDCVRAVVYGLILGAVAMMVGRVLAVFAGAGSWLIWCLGWAAWIVKAVGGLGFLW